MRMCIIGGVIILILIIVIPSMQLPYCYLFTTTMAVIADSAHSRRNPLGVHNNPPALTMNRIRFWAARNWISTTTNTREDGRGIVMD